MWVKPFIVPRDLLERESPGLSLVPDRMFHELLPRKQPRREAEIDRLYQRLHECSDSVEPSVVEEHERLQKQLRRLQEQEADAMESRFVEQCALPPGQGYAALALGESLIAEYAHLAEDDSSSSDSQH